LQHEGIDAATTPGRNSQFDVVADGELVFSKQRMGRFPDDGELLGLLSGR
jgi:predicted Rdx family selenoprotein